LNAESRSDPRVRGHPVRQSKKPSRSLQKPQPKIFSDRGCLSRRKNLTQSPQSSQRNGKQLGYFLFLFTIFSEPLENA
jgi:hypothetical protein